MNMDSEMNTVSSFPVMSAMHRGLFTQPPAMQSQPDPQASFRHGHSGAHYPIPSAPSCFPRDFTCFELCFQNHLHPNNSDFKESSSDFL